jgi:hypothetical protein
MPSSGSNGLRGAGSGFLESAIGSFITGVASFDFELREPEHSTAAP